MTVRICGIPHTITLVDDSRTVDHDGNMNNLHGQIDHGRASIRIATNTPHERVHRTLWHEVLHGIGEGYRVQALLQDTAYAKIEDTINQIAAGVAESLETMDDECLALIGLKRIE